MEYCRCCSYNKKGMCNEWSIKCIICWILCTINNNSHNKYEQQRSKCVYKVYGKARPMAHNWHTASVVVLLNNMRLCNAQDTISEIWLTVRFSFTILCATQNGIGTKLQTVYEVSHKKSTSKFWYCALTLLPMNICIWKLLYMSLQVFAIMIKRLNDCFRGRIALRYVCGWLRRLIGLWYFNKKDIAHYLSYCYSHIYSDVYSTIASDLYVLCNVK